MPSPSRWPGLCVVATVSGMLQAQILKAKLEAAEIEAILDYESAGLLFGITAVGLDLSQVSILVAEQDVERAQQALEAPPPPGWEQETADPPQAP